MKQRSKTILANYVNAFGWYTPFRGIMADYVVFLRYGNTKYYDQNNLRFFRFIEHWLQR